MATVLMESMILWVDFNSIIKLEADNSISLVSLGSWAPELKLTLGLNSGSYDPVTGVIELNVKYGANNQLSVTLTK